MYLLSSEAACLVFWPHGPLHGDAGKKQELQPLSLHTLRGPWAVSADW